MGDHWVRTFAVSDPQRHSKGFTVYKVSSSVSPRDNPGDKTDVVVWKRYSDFQKLHKELKTRHEKLYLKDEFPPFTKPRLFGRFEVDVVEERRSAAQGLLDFVAAHPSLFMSQSFTNFMERSYSVSQGKKKINGDHLSAQAITPLCGESELTETLSQTSSHSTPTDTDSTQSCVSSPAKVLDPNRSLEDKIVVTDSLSTLSSSPTSLEHFSYQNTPSVLATCAFSNPGNPSEGFNSSYVQPSASAEGGKHTDSTCHIMDYMTQAAYHVSKAVEHETDAKFEAAFVSYKNAISFLLSGVQDDPDEDRKLLVQKKAAQYLLRAEKIYHNYLAFSHSTTRSIPRGTGSVWNSLEAPIVNLKAFKVLGIISRVILAMNTHTDTPCIIKVLQKSPCPIDKRTKSIIPTNVPFMCRLFCFMENEHSVFLVLEQATGGCLWDHIRPYFEFLNSSLHNPANNDIQPDVQSFFPQEDLSNALDKTDAEFVFINQHSSEAMPVDSDKNKVLLNSKQEILVELNDCQRNGVDLDQAAFPDVLSSGPASTFQASLDVPDVVTCDKSTSSRNNIDIETENILQNSQRLLASVSRTLSASSSSSTMFMLSENRVCTPQAVKDLNPLYSLKEPPTVSDHKTNLSRDQKPISGRDRKTSTGPRHRSRNRFSCDDMFEGRARATSHSLDREALQMNTQPSSSVLPIDTVCIWAAELLLNLDALHRWGIVIGDLRPENLLIGRGLNLMVTYQCHWVCVDRTPHPEAIDLLYAAPEVGGIEPMTPAADWWSFGAILFELLSGEALASYHPGGIQRYSTLLLPPCIPEDAANLLRQLLKYNAQDRLGGGPHGVAKLKSHSFFKNIEWNNILLMSAST